MSQDMGHHSFYFPRAVLPQADIHSTRNQPTMPGGVVVVEKNGFNVTKIRPVGNNSASGTQIPAWLCIYRYCTSYRYTYLVLVLKYQCTVQETSVNSYHSSSSSMNHPVLRIDPSFTFASLSFLAH